MREAYPLQWPANRPRTPERERKRAQFGKVEKTKSTITDRVWSNKKSLSVADAVSRLIAELGRFDTPGNRNRVPSDSIIVTTNVRAKKDGTPYSNQPEPKDCGVAVYFTLDKKAYCMPCDKWDRLADNIAAVAGHLSAMRATERYGVGSSSDVFMGFAQLPEAGSGESWWSVLGINADADTEDVKAAYRKRAMDTHPDRGGTTEGFHKVQDAYKQAMEALGQPV